MFKKMKLTNKKIFAIALVVVAIHFVATSAIFYCSNTQAVDQTEKIDKELRDKIFTSPRNYPGQKLEEEVKILSQKIKKKNEEVWQRWKIPAFVMSLPITYFISPHLVDFIKKRQDKLLSKEISGGQFLTEGILIVCAANLANSFAFGLLVYTAIRILNHKAKHASWRAKTRNKASKKSRQALAERKKTGS